MKGRIYWANILFAIGNVVQGPAVVFTVLYVVDLAFNWALVRENWLNSLNSIELLTASITLIVANAMFIAARIKYRAYDRDAPIMARASMGALGFTVVGAVELVFTGRHGLSIQAHVFDLKSIEPIVALFLVGAALVTLVLRFPRRPRFNVH